MIQQAYITAWRATAPWQDDAQVEQNLVLSRAVVEIFRQLNEYPVSFWGCGARDICLCVLLT